MLEVRLRDGEEAVQVALNEAGKTIKGITGVEVIDMTGKVDPSTGKINLYKVAVKIAFGVNIYNFHFFLRFKIKF